MAFHLLVLSFFCFIFYFSEETQFLQYEKINLKQFFLILQELQALSSMVFQPLQW